MFVLKDLWYGNIAPNERAMKDGGEYQKAIRRATALADDFRKEMSNLDVRFLLTGQQKNGKIYQ